MKILNLYAGIGGNRKLWGDSHEITAVELDPKIAEIYQDFFPNDRVLVEDAHSYLLKHYKEYDFIWSSPPCPTHSRTNTFLNAQGIVRYPDMSLWQEIVFLTQWFRNGKWVVENVISYYPPLYPPKLLGRHYFWSNFNIPSFETPMVSSGTNSRGSTRRPTKDHYNELETYHGIKLDKSVSKRLLLLRNCVYPSIGLYILNKALNIKEVIGKQTGLFYE